MDEEQRNKEAPQDFRMRYQVAIEDIKYIKTRQWSVTYYLLLLFGALIAFYNLNNHNVTDSAWLTKVLALIALLVAALGTYFLADFQKRLSDYRAVVRYIIEEKKLSDAFLEHESKEKNWDEYTSLWKDLRFTLSFTLMLWLGAILVLYYLKIFDGLEMVSVLPKFFNSLGFAVIVIGSLGMIAFATKFSLSSRIKDLRLSDERLFNCKFLDGWCIWKWSWILIIFGSLIQIVTIWMF